MICLQQLGKCSNLNKFLIFELIFINNNTSLLTLAVNYGIFEYNRLISCRKSNDSVDTKCSSISCDVPKWQSCKRHYVYIKNQMKKKNTNKLTTKSSIDERKLSTKTQFHSVKPIKPEQSN